MKMTNHDVVTDIITERDLTEEEILAIEAKIAAKAEAEAQREEARKAVLNRLGITEEEAKLLLG
jgi:hypothetical protein